MIQNEGATTGWFWQHDHRRELPAERDRFLAVWQIMHVLRGSICRGDCFRACYLTRIDSYPQPFSWVGLWQVAREDFSQVLCINTPIFKCLIQTGPFPFKPERLRQFGKRFRLRLCHQSIDRVEQHIFRFQKTVIDIVTKPSYCVTVFQTSKLPLVFFLLGTLLDEAALRKVGGPFV